MSLPFLLSNQVSLTSTFSRWQEWLRTESSSFIWSISMVLSRLPSVKLSLTLSSKFLTSSKCSFCIISSLMTRNSALRMPCLICRRQFWLILLNLGSQLSAFSQWVAANIRVNYFKYAVIYHHQSAQPYRQQQYGHSSHHRQVPLRLRVGSYAGVVESSRVGLARTLAQELQGAEDAPDARVATAPQHEVARLTEHAAGVGGHWSLVDDAVALPTAHTGAILGVVARLACPALSGAAALLTVGLIAGGTAAVRNQKVALTARLAGGGRFALAAVVLAGRTRTILGPTFQEISCLTLFALCTARTQLAIGSAHH